MNLILLELIDSTIYYSNKIKKTRFLNETDSIIIAKNQTKGKGKNSRKWIDCEGNLNVSIILKFFESEKINLLPLIVPIAIIETILTLEINKKNKNNFKIKWPNDILIDGKKISGILLFLDQNTIDIHYGINVLKKPDIKFKKTSSLLDNGYSIYKNNLINHEDSIHFNKKVYEAVMNYLKNDKILKNDILEKYNRYAYRVGEEVQISIKKEIFTGIFEKINEFGNMVLKINPTESKEIAFYDHFL